MNDDGTMTEQHLKHKLSEMTELKDALMRGEIKYEKFKGKAYPLQKEIATLQEKLKIETLR